MQDLTIALFPHDICWLDPDANRRAVEQYISSQPSADLWLLPEAFTTGFGDEMSQLAEPEEGSTLRWAQSLAARYDVLVVASWIVSTPEGCRNRMHWVQPDGRYGYYDKAHLFRVSSEAAQLQRGTRQVVFTWRGWRIKPAVCYDLRFPLWLRNHASPVGELDYDLLLLCANWPASRSEAWTTLVKARAIENLCYVAACNRTGSDPLGTTYAADSLISDYRGTPLEGLRATLSLAKLQHFRQRWPFYLDFDE